MKYQEVMLILSQCGLGAVLLAEGDAILTANGAADRMLHGKGKLAGKNLRVIAGELCMQDDPPQYANVVFGQYLQRCPTPVLDDLPDGCRMVVFRDATNDACHDIMLDALNHVSEAMVICDVHSRIWLLNNAAAKIDSLSTKDVLGEDVASVYSMLDGSQLILPSVLQRQKPIIGQRQHYKTRYGKDIKLVADAYPMSKNGQLLGAFNVMRDLSLLEELHKQVIDLQDKLTPRPSDRPRKKSALSAHYHFEDIIYHSACMEDVIARCRQVAKTNASVMFFGETGTGKELFAQSVHNASPRKDGPFLAINCAAIPDNLLESLLFGTEKGAYTGAERRPGLLEQANGGTLLLDEINSMNITLQSKLLRVLQDGIVRRVGGMNEIQVDVRVLSNINIPPHEAIERNLLRRDLYYRLGVVNINIPPLRERKEDIMLLARHFIQLYNSRLGKNVHDVDTDTQHQFLAYDWPGNVRELQHAVEHAMSILPDDASAITLSYLPEHILHLTQTRRAAAQGKTAQQKPSLASTVHSFERNAICDALLETGGKISEAARMLGVSRQTLQYRMKRNGIDVKELLREAQNDPKI